MHTTADYTTFCFFCMMHFTSTFVLILLISTCFSFSMKFNGGLDSSVPTSPSRHTSNKNDDGISYAYSVPTSPNSSMNSFLAQGAPQQDSTKNPFSWHRYPFLSRFRSNSGDKKDTSHYVSSMDSEYEGTPVSLESSIANNNFHFSFYKWGGKGAVLVLPTTAQENAGDIVGVRSFPQVIVQGMDLIDEEDSTSTATGASKSQTDYEDYKSGKDVSLGALLKTKDGALPLAFDDYVLGDKSEESGVLLFRVLCTSTCHYRNILLVALTSKLSVVNIFFWVICSR